MTEAADRGVELVIPSDVVVASHFGADAEHVVARADAIESTPFGANGIGLDIGEATPVDDGYRGAALNRAARLCSLAGAGETLVSPGVVYVAPHIEGVRFEARGQAQLKGFPEPVAILLAAPTGVIESDDTATDEQSE